MGDSVSAGYAEVLNKSISQYNVVHIGDNARNSWYTLQNVDSWLDKFSPEIVIWNNGLWSVCYQGYHNEGAPLEHFWESDADYEANLKLIASKILSRGIKIIFVSTEYLQPNTSGHFNVGHENVLNQIALDALVPMGAQYVDISTATQSNPSWFQNSYETHFTEEGYKAISEIILNNALF